MTAFALLSLVLAYLLFTTKRDLSERIVYIDQQNGMVMEERDGLKFELEQMQQEFSNMETTNTQMRDSINWQSNRIAQLLRSVNNQNVNIDQLRKERDELRKIMKSYLHDIDSLQRANDRLTVEKDNETSRANAAENKSSKLEQDLTSVKGEVSKAAILQASGFTNIGIKEKSRGGEKEVERASQAQQIKSCFTIRQNPVARSGSRKLYMRIEGPTGQVLGSGTKINIEGQETTVSAMREIDYQNNDTDVCIYAITGGGLTKGTYKITVFEGGKLIGSSTLVFTR
jgi:hypothetical protein